MLVCISVLFALRLVQCYFQPGFNFRFIFNILNLFVQFSYFFPVCFFVVLFKFFYFHFNLFDLLFLSYCSCQPIFLWLIAEVQLSFLVVLLLYFRIFCLFVQSWFAALPVLIKTCWNFSFVFPKISFLVFSIYSIGFFNICSALMSCLSFSWKSFSFKYWLAILIFRFVRFVSCGSMP